MATAQQTFDVGARATDHGVNVGEIINEISSTRDTTPPGKVIIEILGHPDGSLGVRRVP